MTSATTAAQELKTTLEKVGVMGSEDYIQKFLDYVSLDLEPATAIRLADYLTGTLQPGAQDPNQRQFDFTTE